MQEDHAENFIFKIRNLFGFQPDSFTVIVDSEKQELVLKTSNKKYFKRFQVGDLIRNNLKLDQSAVSVVFSNNILLVYYKKPIEIVFQEAQKKIEFEKLNAKKPEEGDLECSVQ